MTQTVPATAVLGSARTGLAIGLRVLNLDGTTYAAFATTGVAETSVAGTYRKAGGVVAPLAGGYIVFGTALVDYAEVTVESVAVNVTLWKGATAPDAPPSNAQMEARTLAAADYVVVGDTLAAVTTVGSVTGAVGSVTAGVTLANDAITAAKFDETTAFPLKSADTGATAVARTGADGDTLKTLSDQMDVAGGGTGLYSNTITVNDGDGLPLDGVLVQVATDSAFSNVVRSGYTDNLGQVTLNFDAAGTYYGRAEISDFNVTTFTVTIS